MAKTPSAYDMHIAAQWLSLYEGEEDAEACHMVAAWLLEQAENSEFRAACRAAGVSVGLARKAIKNSAT